MKVPEVLKADELKLCIFGDPKTHAVTDRRFYYDGSSMRNAERMRKLSAGAPNIKPTPFIIPPAYLSDHYYLRNGNPGMPEAKWQEYIGPRSYIIEHNSRWGGNQNYDNYIVDWLEFKPEIFINNCTFKENLNIDFLKIQYSLNFYNCIFDKDVIINYTEASLIQFSKCSIKNSKVSIANSNIKSIKFKDCEISDLNFSTNYNNESLQNEFIIPNDIEHAIESMIISDSLINNIRIAGEKYSDILLENNSIAKSTFDIIASDLKIKNKSKEKLIINKLNIHLPENQSNYLTSIENLQVESLSITGKISNSTIILLNLVINHLKIFDLVNEGKLRFHDLSINNNGSIEILRSQLGKAEFNTVNFNNAQSTKIYLSNITEIITHNTAFPDNIISKSDSSFDDIREIYRQLKNAASKQGDKVNELRYEEQEMVRFKNILAQGGGKYNHDLWILLLNEWSNRHGQDWRRAGYILFVCTLVSFTTIKLLLGYTCFDISVIFSNIADYITFAINPLHKFTDIFIDSSNKFLTGLSKLIDVLTKLFSGYMIFQFLRAFRKYYK